MKRPTICLIWIGGTFETKAGEWGVALSTQFSYELNNEGKIETTTAVERVEPQAWSAGIVFKLQLQSLGKFRIVPNTPDSRVDHEVEEQKADGH